MKINVTKSLLAVASAGSLLAMSASSAFAVNGLNNLCPAPGPFAGVCGNTNQLIGQVVNLVFVVAIVISLAFLIYAGIRYILSQGDKTKVGAAREMIVAALIGLIIVFLSYFLINLAVQMLFGQTINQVVSNVTNTGIFSPGQEGSACQYGDGTNQCAGTLTCRQSSGGPAVTAQNTQGTCLP